MGRFTKALINFFYLKSSTWTEIIPGNHLVKTVFGGCRKIRTTTNRIVPLGYSFKNRYHNIKPFSMVLEKYRLFSEFIYFLCVIKRGLASHLKLIIFVHLFPYAFFCRVVSIKRHQRYQNWVENGSFECSTICPGLF